MEKKASFLVASQQPFLYEGRIRANTFVFSPEGGANLTKKITFLVVSLQFCACECARACVHVQFVNPYFGILC